MSGVVPRSTLAPHQGSDAFVHRNGELCARIPGYDRLAPFLVNVPSDTDIWMFVSSAGGLTAGRVSAEHSLFPYETVDRLHQGHAHTGPITLVRLQVEGRPVIWEPLSADAARSFRLERALYKNTTGNRLSFEEQNRDLQLLYEQTWSSCDEFGIVRTVRLRNLSDAPVRLELLDGLRNVLPYGAPLSLYQTASSLVDAYKRADLDPETGLGIFSLTSRIVDRPEAAEVLRANVVWCHGLEPVAVALATDAATRFREGARLDSDREHLGRAASYLVATAPLVLSPRQGIQWWIVADAGLDHRRIASLRRRMTTGTSSLGSDIERALATSRDNLRRIVASADGLQESASLGTSVHHATTVLFNSMRGGVFVRNHGAPGADFREFVTVRNRGVAERHAAFLEALPGELSVDALVASCAEVGSADLHRISLEYLPLYFGRRHGDPSRPWNRFELRMKREDGSRSLGFEGNWRDIFQNWDALGASFPRFLPNFIAKFVNASTVDGFNPYRLTRDGFDWETPDPGDPWSCIGYWGDHQVAYLLRFLESLQRYEPGALERLLDAEIFAYADVPYRIRSYERIVENPRATIDYDDDAAERVRMRVRAEGSDGALVRGADGGVYHVTLLEKLLVPALSKLSNLVPDGGIWMNTQRPEWNDANNALAGPGLSVVTLCYLRRYLELLREIVSLRLRQAPRGSARGEQAAPVSSEVVRWLRDVHTALADGAWARDRTSTLSAEAGARARGALVDALGRCFSRYRAQVYAHGFAGKVDLTYAEVARLCGSALEHLDRSIVGNRREDGLYHSYNLIDGGSRADHGSPIDDHGDDLATDGAGHGGGGLGAVRIQRLAEMLEGQVAVLHTGVVGAEEAAEIVDRLFASPLYSPRQRSFLLYPERRLPGFLQRNVIPEEAAMGISLLRDLLAHGSSHVLLRDDLGVLRFHPDLARIADLERALDDLGRQPKWTAAVARDRAAVIALFDAVFGHSSYTGRSGAMHGYEGLGCVYWHMVSKLALAVQEQARRAAESGAASATIDRLVDHYHRIRAGLGYQRTPEDYGAFPTDPYSHTPPHGGASQPGMTGQVKEDILSRFGELGIEVRDGCLAFRPLLLRRAEFGGESRAKSATGPSSRGRVSERLSDSSADGRRFEYFDLDGEARSLELPPSSLAFTFCQVPIVYVRSTDAWLQITDRSGGTRGIDGSSLDRASSQAVFARDGSIVRIEVGVPDDSLR